MEKAEKEFVEGKIEQIFLVLRDMLPKHNSEHGLDDLCYRSTCLQVDYKDEYNFNINYMPSNPITISPEVQLDCILFGYSRACETHEFVLDNSFDYYIRRIVKEDLQGVITIKVDE